MTERHFQLNETVAVHLNGREGNALMGRILAFSNDGNVAFVEMRLDVPVSDLRYIELNPPQPIFCSFCAKTNQEVAQMIAGPKGYICDECVPVCAKILDERKVEETSKAGKRTAGKKRKNSRT